MMPERRLGTVIHFVHDLAGNGGGAWSVVRTLAEQHRPGARLVLIGARKGYVNPSLEKEVLQRFDAVFLVDCPASFASSYTHPIPVRRALDALGIQPEREPVVFHFHTGPCVPWIFRLPRRLPRGVWVSTFHGSRGSFFDTTLPTLPRRLAGILGAKVLVRRGFSLVAVSRRSAADCAAHYWIDPSRFRVIHNGVPRRQGPTERPARGRGEPFHVGFVGTVQPTKGWHRVVEAARLLRNDGYPVICSIVGNGIDGPKLRRLAEAHRDWLRAPGHVADVTGSVFPTLDALVLPSDFEGHSLVLVEALSCGVPCVCSDVGGNAETVRDGLDGFILHQNSPAEIAGKIQRLIDSPDLWRDFSAHCRQRYEAMFTAEIMARAYTRLYQEARGPLLRDLWEDGLAPIS